MYELNDTWSILLYMTWILKVAKLEALKGRKAKGHFTTKGSNFVHSIDGHDKLMGYQNSMYRLAIYGCIDRAS